MARTPTTALLWRNLDWNAPNQSEIDLVFSVGNVSKLPPVRLVLTACTIFSASHDHGLIRKVLLVEASNVTKYAAVDLVDDRLAHICCVCRGCH